LFCYEIKVASRLHKAESDYADALSQINTHKKKEVEYKSEIDGLKKRVEELSNRLSTGSASSADAAKKLLAVEKEKADALSEVEQLSRNVGQVRVRRLSLYGSLLILYFLFY
jgi:chromosome segregation ATPase